jgi:hypothetical protein
MSTVDYSTALKLVRGEYPDSPYKSILIYGNQFGGISFKLCGNGTLLGYMKDFDNQGLPNELVWLSEIAGEQEFKDGVAGFLSYHPECRSVPM